MPKPTEESRRRAVDWTAERIKRSSGDRVSSDKAHSEAAKIAREADKKSKDKAH